MSCCSYSKQFCEASTLRLVAAEECRLGVGKEKLRLCIKPWPNCSFHALCSSGASCYFKKGVVELEAGPGKAERVIRAEVISIQAMTFFLDHGKGVTRDIIEVYALTKHPEAWRGVSIWWLQFLYWKRSKAGSC